MQDAGNISRPLLVLVDDSFVDVVVDVSLARLGATWRNLAQLGAHLRTTTRPDDPKNVIPTLTKRKKFAHHCVRKTIA